MKQAKKTFPIPILFSEEHGIVRKKEPVRLGVPFPKNALDNPAFLSMVDSKNHEIPIQTKVLSQWKDGSVKWLLVDFLVDLEASTRTEYTIQKTHAPQTNAGLGITIEQNKKELIVRAAGTIFFINTKEFKPFNKVTDSFGNEYICDTETLLKDATGISNTFHISDIAVEEHGSVRATLKICGSISPKTKNDYLVFSARLTFYDRSSSIQLDFTLGNSNSAEHLGGLWDLGDKGSYFFKDLSLNLHIKKSADAQLSWSTAPLTSQEATKDTISIYQDSSGGENWQSTTHSNKEGQVCNSFQGFQVLGPDKSVLLKGHRALPEIQIHNNGRSVGGAIKKFWQNFPKGITASPGKVSFHLFPAFYNDDFELQGGEQKTHTLFLNFCEKKRSLSQFHFPLKPTLPPAYYRQTEVFPFFTPVSNDFRDYEELIETAVNGENSFFKRREVIDEFGWRNFGDIFADHETYEQKDFQGSTPLISHYNNQYDIIFSALLHYARSGDPNWYTLGHELAEHVIDIDIYHTDEDRAVFNHGLHWHTDHFHDAATSTHRSASIQTKMKLGLKSYGLGPGYDHIYTKGLLYFYFMSGSEQSKEALIELANWAIAGLDGHKTCLEACESGIKKTLHRLKGLLRKGSAPIIFAFDGPGRPSGNVLNTLLDVFELTKNQFYLIKAEQLIRQCVHPHDDVPALGLLDPNTKWMYTIFLQSLSNYVDKKSELGELDEMFFYARESLLLYATWMHDNEYPYLAKPELLDYPNYATRAAQDFRKCNILLHAGRQAKSLEQAHKFFKKADFFYREAHQYLQSYDTKILTRPLAIVMLVGYIRNYYEEMMTLPQITSPENPFDFSRSKRPGHAKLSFLKNIFYRSNIMIRRLSFTKEIKWFIYRIKTLLWEIRN